MLLLDTNVVSELMKAAPNSQVLTWADARPSEEFYVSAVTKGELLFGVALLPASKRRDALAEAVATAFAKVFAGRVLAFDSAAAEVYAEIVAARRRAGRPISAFDAQIAAIARLHGASIATRNVADFEGCGVVVVDPWRAE
jgi:predicted nucleic acid-binding protein